MGGMEQGQTEAASTWDTNITLIFTQPLKMIKTNHMVEDWARNCTFLLIETLMIAFLASDRGLL